MNRNLRALVFGTAVAAVMTLTLNTVYAAEQPQVIRLDTIEVSAHTDVVRLEAIDVAAHRNAA